MNYGFLMPIRSIRDLKMRIVQATLNVGDASDVDPYDPMLSFGLHMCIDSISGDFERIDFYMRHDDPAPVLTLSGSYVMPSIKTLKELIMDADPTYVFDQNYHALMVKLVVNSASGAPSNGNYFLRINAGVVGEENDVQLLTDAAQDIENVIATRRDTTLIVS